MSFKVKNFLPLSLAFVPALSYALAVDWHGSFGVDSTMITDYRRIESKTENAINDGSQEVHLDTGSKDSLSFQSYIFKLSPDILINDTATLKFDLTTGPYYGGFLGDSAQTSTATSGDGGLFYYNQAKSAALNIKKLYLELNADTATYHIGRHSFHWGMGAMINNGNEDWDRHSYSRDGVTMFFKFNNFYVTPFWSGSSNDSTNGTGFTRATDSKEFGSAFLYDNKEKEVSFGAYYSKKTSNAFNQFYKNSDGSQLLGANNVKLLDLYYKQVKSRFTFTAEIPLLSGELGHVYDSTSVTTYSAKAALTSFAYQLNDSWNIAFDGGQVSGNTGVTSKFSAAYLNPNFQIANLLFRYNMSAVKVTTNASGIYDSYLTNARYYKLKAAYNAEKWSFDSSFILAKALETAAAGSSAFNHSNGKVFNALTTQSDDLGKEIDFNAKYKWNKEVSVGAGFAYLMTGDYFAYTNDVSKSNKSKNSMLLQINTLVKF